MGEVHTCEHHVGDLIQAEARGRSWPLGPQMDWAWNMVIRLES